VKKKKKKMCPFSKAHLDEGEAGPVVGDGEAQRILRLEHFHLLLDAPDVGEDEVLQADLPTQQLLHVDLVGVQGAEEDLHTHTHTHTRTSFSIDGIHSDVHFEYHTTINGSKVL